jgi:hypothetical protein
MRPTIIVVVTIPCDSQLQRSLSACSTAGVDPSTISQGKELDIMKKPIFLLALSITLAASTAYAFINTVPTRITFIEAYTEYGNGDVSFGVENPLPQCNGGFWLRKTDPGFASNLSALLSAYHARSTVMIFAHPDQLWGGSGNSYCRVHGLRLQQP